MWGHGRSAWVERVGSGCGFDAGDGVSSEGGDGTGAHEGARRAGRTVDHWTALAGDLDHVAAKRKVSVVWTSLIASVVSIFSVFAHTLVFAAIIPSLSLLVCHTLVNTDIIWSRLVQ